jgi:hypothetical protein
MSNKKVCVLITKTFAMEYLKQFDKNSTQATKYRVV